MMKYIVVALVLMPGVAGACTKDIGLATTVENLSTPFENWRSIELDYRCRYEDRRTLTASISRDQRFGNHDTTLAGSWYQPVGTHTGWLFEAQYSPQGNSLPEHALAITFDRRFGEGWVVHGGLRHTRYRGVSVDSVRVTTERYHGNLRFAWIYGHDFLNGGGSAGTHRVHIDRWYSDFSRVGVFAIRGREVERPTPGLVQITAVRGFGVYGTHWFDDSWAATWSLSHVEQGNFHTRDGIRAGVRHRF